MTEVVNLGGDTDTSGAILGALAGAHYGVEAIPKRWLEDLQNRDGIEARAIALAQRSTRDLQIPDLISTEHALTRKEMENFEPFAAVGGTSSDDRGANHLV